MPQHQVTLKLSAPATSTGVVSLNSIILKLASAKYDVSTALLRSHPETRRSLRYMPEKISTEDVRALREKWANHEENLYFDILLVENGEEQHIGGAGISRMDMNNRNAGVIISPKYYHQGVATVALYLVIDFTFYGTVEGCKPPLHRVLFQTGADNVGMRGWLENTAKIRLEGIFKEHWKESTGDMWSDVAFYGLLEQEWMEEVKGRLERKIGIAN